MSIAQRLGYVSVVEILRPVTEVSVVVADEKYRVISPEIMQEAPMSDSEDEGGNPICFNYLICLCLNIYSVWHNVKLYFIIYISGVE